MKRRILAIGISLVIATSGMTACGEKDTSVVTEIEEESEPTIEREAVAEESVTPDVNAMQGEIEAQEENSEEIDEVKNHKEVLKEYQDEENYIGAIQYYDEKVGSDSDPELRKIKEELVDNFIRQEIKIADSLLTDNDAKASIEEIEKAEDMYPDDRWKKCIEYYQTVVATPMTIMQAYHTDGNGRGICKSIGQDTILSNVIPHDQFGKEYGTAFLYGTPSGYNNLSMTYNLDGKYTKLTGVVSETQNMTGSPGPNFQWRDTYLSIYCDEELVYQSPEINDSMRPQDIEIDVTDVLDIRLEYIGNYEVLLNDPMLYPKNLGEPLYEHLEEIVGL